MKRTLSGILAGVLVVTAAVSADAKKLDLARLKDVAAKYRFALDVVSPGTKKHRFIYANNRNRLFVYEVGTGGAELKWENSNLGSRATALLVADFNGDGKQSIVVATARGRILVYGLEDYQLEYENINDNFSSISTMTAANLDDDVQEELIILGGDVLYIFDGLNRTVEWSSTDSYVASQIVVGNTDDDAQPEIIMNSGWVIDSRFYNVEFEADAPFGDRIMLIDMNGDGYDDVFGEFLDLGLKVFDIYAQREMW